MRFFIVKYEHEDRICSFTIPAESKEEAEEHFESILENGVVLNKVVELHALGPQEVKPLPGRQDSDLESVREELETLHKEVEEQKPQRMMGTMPNTFRH